NPEGLGEMMKRVLHAVQLAVPIGIITRPNIAQSAQQPRHCIRLAQDFVVVRILLSGFIGIKEFFLPHSRDSRFKKTEEQKGRRFAVFAVLKKQFSQLSTRD
ncbi:MAG: hypothetical protein J5980_02230, partial [Muribaculaceae bacterium]|nr:hypothetical protein [Muribaculaceae bacterium]